jgi:membrane fusion protein
MADSLFRPEALEANRNTGMGEVHIATPISFTAFMVFAVVAAMALAAFAIAGTYTRKARVMGQLVPNSGLVKIIAPQAATVAKRHIGEGELVRKGQTLFTLSIDRSSIIHGNTQAAIGEQLKHRRSSLTVELEKQKLISSQEESALRKKLADMELELKQVGGEIDNQKNRLQLAEQTVKRYHDLAASNFVSEVQAQQKVEELLDQRARLQTLERNRASLERESSSTGSELSIAPLRARQQLENLERGIMAMDQDLTENEARREITVIASQDGYASNIQADLGQSVSAGAPLLAIVPADAVLEAHLYAPSRSIGFIQPDSPVLMRYQAFPYQKFGQHTGVISTISRTTLAPQDYALPGLNSLANEPLYRITVKLSKQHVLAYGQQQKLQPGMMVEADVLLDRRRIYEWILDPLYSVLGRV